MSRCSYLNPCYADFLCTELLPKFILFAGRVPVISTCSKSTLSTKGKSGFSRTRANLCFFSEERLKIPVDISKNDKPSLILSRMHLRITKNHLEHANELP